MERKFLVGLVAVQSIGIFFFLNSGVQSSGKDLAVLLKKTTEQYEKLQEMTRMLETLNEELLALRQNVSTIGGTVKSMSNRENSEKVPKVHNLLHLLEAYDAYKILHGQPRSLVVDVGAHVGTVTNRIVKYGHRVIAIEPYSGNIPMFWVTNRGYEDSITLKEGAASNFTGECKVQAHSNSFNGTDSTATVGRGKGIKCWKLDDLIHETVYFMKIDVQGHELEVLTGAENLISQFGVDFIYVEYMPRYRPVFDFLVSHGYQCFDTSWAQYGEKKMEIDSLRDQPVITERNFTLTIGKPGRDVWVKNRKSNIDQWTKDLEISSQTDLLCVKKSLLS